MKIYLDNLIFSLQSSGGVSTYWYELISRLSKNSDLNTLFIESKSKFNNILSNNLNLDRDKILYKDTGILSRVLPINIRESERFIFHSSYYRFVNNDKSHTVTTVHDFIQERLYKNNFNLNVLMKKRAIKKSNFFIAVSKNTKSDLLHYYPEIDPESIEVIHNGISDEYYLLDERTRDKLKESSNSVLFVGSRAKYKNFNFAVELISKFRSLKLTIVGNELTPVEINLLNNKLKESQWEIVVSPSNEQLNLLYNRAKLLLYPSSYEGFGIPIIEAMRCGCPVIALRSSSIPEVAGDAALLVDKLSIDDFHDGINEIISNSKYFIDKGLNNASKYSWQRTYSETLNFYSKLLLK